MMSVQLCTRPLQTGPTRSCTHRLLSLTALKNGKSEEAYPPNSSLKITAIHNRNPRNLEKLRITPKPQGWYLEKPGRNYWNKIILEFSSKHVTSKVLHFYGHVPVVASTKEWCIQKYLYSTRDLAAVEAVARVFTQRCLESGILELYSPFTDEDKKKSKVEIFVNTLEKGGLVLAEPENLKTADWLHYPYTMERPWEYHENAETGEIRQDTPIATECNTYKAVTKRPLQ